eukprot:6511319-Heterocapsa_arctica.AAC.1
MHGGDRDKLTTFRVNFDEASALAVRCDGSHTHKPWGVVRDQSRWKFATAEETAYPHLLCRRFAET